MFSLGSSTPFSSLMPLAALGGAKDLPFLDLVPFECGLLDFPKNWKPLGQVK